MLLQMGSGIRLLEFKYLEKFYYITPFRIEWVSRYKNDTVGPS